MIRVFIFNCSSKCQVSFPDWQLDGLYEFCQLVQTCKLSRIVEFSVVKSIFCKDISVRIGVTPTTNCREVKNTIKSFLHDFYKDFDPKTDLK